MDPGSNPGGTTSSFTGRTGYKPGLSIPHGVLIVFNLPCCVTGFASIGKTWLWPGDGIGIRASLKMMILRVRLPPGLPNTT